MYQDNKNLDSLGLPPCDCTPDYDYPENPDWLWFFTEWQKIKDQIGDYPSLEKMIQENKKSINTLTDAQKDNVLKSLQAVKTMDMVQPVGIDTDGRLWVKPSSGGPAAVVSVNGKTGVVKLTAADVGALPADTPIPPAYNLPVATDTRLGGVRPETKTDDMTQPVGVDTSGRLFTAPGSGGSGPAYTLPIASQDKLGGVKASPITPDQTEPVGIDAAGKLFTAPSKGGGTGEKEVEVSPNTPLPNSVVLWVDPDEPAPLVNLVVDVESPSQGGYQANYTADDIRKYAQDNTVIELRYQSDRYRFDGMVDDYGPRQGMAQFSRIQIAPDDIDQLTIFVDDAGAVTTDNSVFEHNNSLGIMGAAVGDLARVKAVDSNGVPTVWEPTTLEELEGKWEHIESFALGYEEVRELPDGWYEPGFDFSGYLVMIGTYIFEPVKYNWQWTPGRIFRKSTYAPFDEFVRTAEPNGKQYRFRGLFFSVHMPNKESQKTYYQNVNSNQDNITIMSAIIPIVSGQYKYHYAGITTPKNGVYTNMSYDGEQGKAPNVSSSTNPGSGSYMFSSDKPITKVRFYGYGNGNFPEGTIFEIYALR